MTPPFRKIIALVSLVSSLSLAIWLTSCLPVFWDLSLYPRLGLVAACAVPLAILIYWVQLRGNPRISRVFAANRWIILAGLLLVSVYVILNDPLPTPLRPVAHKLEIEVIPIAAGMMDGQPSSVRVNKIIGPEGETLPFEIAEQTGSWVKEFEGLSAAGNQSARLTFSLLNQRHSQLAIKMETCQGCGQVILRLDSQEKRVDLNAPIAQETWFYLPIAGSPWESPILLAKTLSIDFITAMVLLWLLGILSGQRLALRTQKLPYDTVFIACILILLLLPLQNFSGSLSTFDNKFWGRPQLLQALDDFRYIVLHDRFYTGIVTGKNGWTFYNNDQVFDDFQNAFPFTANELKTAQQRLDGIKQRLDQKGIKLLIVVVPEKNNIYPEDTLEGLPKFNPQSRLDQLIAYQAQHGQTQLLDLRPVLLQARTQHQLYYQLEHHWNVYGAWLGYDEIIKALRPDFPEVGPSKSLAQFEAADYVIDFRQFAGSMALRTETTFQAASDKDPAVIWDFKRFAQPRPNIDYDKMVITYRNGAKLPRLLVYCDSYAFWIEPLLRDHFSWAIYYHYYFDQLADEKVLEQEKPDIVLIEIAESNLSYFTRPEGQAHQ